LSEESSELKSAKRLDNLAMQIVSNVLLKFFAPQWGDGHIKSIKEVIVAQAV